MVPDMDEEALTAMGAETVEPTAGEVTVTPVVVLVPETVKVTPEDFAYCPAEFHDWRTRE
jgi:hypothetical protein